eukprot:TRINITY_DN16076_c0_g1_i1.p1 TRINITY_DN16076_c0_g1~~TRINITY_DN16076_c0_g1_i1.p1  ORF type:complete len:289 (+),score=67.70 TRINITY_DN16076_c0_g1_i1:99-965(+)
MITAAAKFFVVAFRPVLCSEVNVAMEHLSRNPNAVLRSFSTKKEAEDVIKALDPLNSESTIIEKEERPQMPDENDERIDRVAEELQRAADSSRAATIKKVPTPSSNNSASSFVHSEGKKSPTKDVYYYYILNDAELTETKKKINSQEVYHMFFDGASKSNPGPAGAGFAFFDEASNQIFTQAFHTGYRTNNEAEYVGLVYGLKVASKLGIKKIKVYGDSMLVVKQLKGEYKVKAPNLFDLSKEARMLSKLFEKFDIQYVPRESNSLADRLANEGVAKYRDFLKIKEKA